MTTLGTNPQFGGMPKQENDPTAKVAGKENSNEIVEVVETKEEVSAIFDYYSPGVPGLGVGEFVFTNGHLRLDQTKAEEFEVLLTKLDLRTRAMIRTPTDTGGIAPKLPNLVGKVTQIADSGTLFNQRQNLVGTQEIGG